MRQLLQECRLRFNLKRTRSSPDQAFATARWRVRWHYQWLVLHDFVRRIVGEKIFNEVWNNGEPDVRFYDPLAAAYPFMPVEFAVAAYRLGHSMVRPGYSLSTVIPHAKTGSLERLAIFAPTANCQDVSSLNGFRPLISEWGIDWAFFLPGLPPPAADEFPNFKVPQPSYRLDTMLVDPLRKLPDHLDQPLPRQSLASLNLLRGIALGLPSGQAVARRMGQSALSDEQLWMLPGNITENEPTLLQARRDVFTKNRSALHQNAPLWYYILREAELIDERDVDVSDDPKKKDVIKLGGWHLGPVGGRIVAEVFSGLLMADDQSFLVQHPLWEPEIPTLDAAWGLQLSDIVQFVDAT